MSIGAKASCICSPAANSNHRGIWKLTAVILLLSICCFINFTTLALLRKTLYVACDFAWLVTSEQNDTTASGGSHHTRWLPSRALAGGWRGPCGLDHLNNIADFFSNVWFLMHWYHKSHWCHQCHRAVRQVWLLVFTQQQKCYFLITWLNSAENFKQY